MMNTMSLFGPVSESDNNQQKVSIFAQELIELKNSIEKGNCNIKETRNKYIKLMKIINQYKLPAQQETLRQIDLLLTAAEKAQAEKNLSGTLKEIFDGIKKQFPDRDADKIIANIRKFGLSEGLKKDILTIINNMASNKLLGYEVLIRLENLKESKDVLNLTHLIEKEKKYAGLSPAEKKEIDKTNANNNAILEKLFGDSSYKKIKTKEEAEKLVESKIKGNAFLKKIIVKMLMKIGLSDFEKNSLNDLFKELIKSSKNRDELKNNIEIVKTVAGVVKMDPSDLRDIEATAEAVNIAKGFGISKDEIAGWFAQGIQLAEAMELNAENEARRSNLGLEVPSEPSEPSEPEKTSKSKTYEKSIQETVRAVQKNIKESYAALKEILRDEKKDYAKLVDKIEKINKALEKLILQKLAVGKTQQAEINAKESRRLKALAESIDKTISKVKAALVKAENKTAAPEMKALVSKFEEVAKILESIKKLVAVRITLLDISLKQDEFDTASEVALYSEQLELVKEIHEQMKQLTKDLPGQPAVIEKLTTYVAAVSMYLNQLILEVKQKEETQIEKSQAAKATDGIAAAAAARTEGLTSGVVEIFKEMIKQKGLKGALEFIKKLDAQASGLKKLLKEIDSAIQSGDWHKLKKLLEGEGSEAVLKDPGLKALVLRFAKMKVEKMMANAGSTGQDDIVNKIPPELKDILGITDLVASSRPL